MFRFGISGSVIHILCAVQRFGKEMSAGLVETVRYPFKSFQAMSARRRSAFPLAEGWPTRGRKGCTPTCHGGISIAVQKVPAAGSNGWLLILTWEIRKIVVQSGWKPGNHWPQVVSVFSLLTLLWLIRVLPTSVVEPQRTENCKQERTTAMLISLYTWEAIRIWLIWYLEPIWHPLWWHKPPINISISVFSLLSKQGSERFLDRTDYVWMYEYLHNKYKSIC